MNITEHPEYMKKEGDTELCEHDRLTTGYCEPCAEKKANKLYEDQKARQYAGAIPPNDMPSGLNAPYYDTPFGDVQDMLEWLEEGGANWCVLNNFKSIWREFNPHAKKKTTRLYEAEKRKYYADRDLRNVQKGLSVSTGHSTDAEK